MRYGHRAALGALVVAFALLFFLEGAALPDAWLPVEEAAALQHARGDESAQPSNGVLYPLLLAPAARSLSPSGAHRFAKAVSAVLWALTAIPAFLLARRLVPSGTALVVTTLALVAPGSVYATAAVADGLALLLALLSMSLLVRASERASRRDLVGALLLATLAAFARPWFVVLPPALLIAYELPRNSAQSFLRWPRSLVFAGLAAGAYLLLATTAPEVGSALASPGQSLRAGAASLAVVALGAGLVPWLLAVSGARPFASRPETALLAVCAPALAVAAGVFAASGDGLDERPLLALVPLVLALAASVWVRGVSRFRPAAYVGGFVVLAALALPTLGRAASERGAGLSLVAPNGASKAVLVLVVAVAVGVALALLRLLPRRPVVFAAAVALVLLVEHVAAWSSVRSESRALAASEPAPRGWVDRNAGSGARVFVVGPPGAFDQRAFAQLILWNRAIRGVHTLDLAAADPANGFLSVADSDVVLVRGAELVGTEIARSRAGVLLRVPQPQQVAETIDGLYADGWSGDNATYRRFAGPSKPGTVRVLVSRLNWGGEDRPADVRVDSGPLNATGEQRAHIVIHAGKEYTLEIPVPPPPFQIAITVQPTFAPAEFGAGDARQLGAQITFTYRPGK